MGCVTAPKVATLKEGTCKILHTPQYAVRGATIYDQEWIDDVTEGLVGGCNQPRPKARPPEFDAPKSVVPAPKPAPKKKHWWQR